MAMTWTQRFRNDQSGVSAIEFALILPLMLTLLFGAIELTMLLTADRKASSVASTVADLVAQDNIVDDDELDDIFEAAGAIMAGVAGFSDSQLSIVVSSVVMESAGDISVDCSGAYNGTPKTDDTIGTIPDGLLSPNTSIIVTTVEYEYEAPLSYVMGASFDLGDTLYLRPRRSQSIVCDGW